MKNFKEIKISEKKIVSVTCDKCGKTICFTDNDFAFKGSNVHEMFDYQNWLHFNFTGGYNSIFGDGNEYECDLCQQCTKKLLGNYLRKI